MTKHIQLSMPPIEVESGERELVLRSNTTQSFTIPKVQPAVVDDAPQPRAEPVEPAVPQGPQTPYAGRGHFPDKEPSLASDNESGPSGIRPDAFEGCIERGCRDSMNG